MSTRSYSNQSAHKPFKFNPALSWNDNWQNCQNCEELDIIDENLSQNAHKAFEFDHNPPIVGHVLERVRNTKFRKWKIEAKMLI